VPLPLPLTTEQLSDEALVQQFHEHYRGAGIRHDTSQAASATGKPSNASSFLKTNVQIGLITQDAMAELYSGKVATKSWKQAQQAMTGLCEQLEAWLASLPAGLNFSQPGSGISLQRERLILKMQYIGTKILITRPSLCRLDRRIVNQSKASDNFNKQTAQICVGAAVAMADLLPEEVDATYLYKIGPWWSIVHNLMQALIVLLLEISYGAVHFPREGKQILAPIKKLFRWLRTMSNRNDIAERAYNMASTVLQRLASKFNIDISALMREDTTRTGHSTAFHLENQQSAMGPHLQEHTVSPTEHTQAFGEQAMYASGFHENQPGYAPMFAVPAVQPQDSPWVVGSTDARETLLPGISQTDLMFSNPFTSGYDEENPVTPGEDLFRMHDSSSRFQNL